MDCEENSVATSELVTKSTAVEKEEECSVCVAVNIRPLIGNELVEGCQECLQVAAEQAQVTCCGKNFLFDRVYGACSASPSSDLFGDCIQPLVDMLFKGYNATVLAYGQTGSGKTFTMGSAFTPGQEAKGVIPSVLDRIFERIKSNPLVECTVRTSFVEIHKEEIRDLLVYGENTAKMNRTTTVSVREMPGGGVCLAGATEREVTSKEQTGELLLQGSQFRATASTNMNSRSSRSHAIFTITLEQKKQVSLNDDNPKNSDDEDEAMGEDQMVEDFLTAKMHLVDLAGSERAKRTKAEGQRLKEGIDINKGLLALGKVISSLVENHRHVPYRDSKLTRLLQDSLGGNSRTVMIACVSPADINMEETINTLRYANQARSIKNKPVVNRDPVAAQFAYLRQQLALARSELALYKKTTNLDDLQLSGPDTFLQEELENSIKQRKFLEQENSKLKYQSESASREAKNAQEARIEAQCKLDWYKMHCANLSKTLAQLQEEGVALPDPIEGLPALGSEDIIQGYLDRIAELERENTSLRDLRVISENFMERASMGHQNTNSSMNFNRSAFAAIPELADVDSDLVNEQMAAAEEEAYRLEQQRLGEELKTLEESLELKEQQIKKVAASSSQVEILKQQFEKQLQTMENKKTKLEKERQDLVNKLQSLKAMSHEEQLRLEEYYRMQLKEKDEELKELKKKEKEFSKVLKLKHKADDACTKLRTDVEKMKSQKVQLYRQIDLKNKEHNEKMRRKDKEMMQLKKQSRATQAKLQKMEALQIKQQNVLRRKTEEAEAARRRLKELSSASNTNSGGNNNRSQSESRNKRSSSADSQASNLSNVAWNDKSRLEWLEQELDGCNQSIVLKRMLDGEVEQRKYASKVYYETERRIEHLQEAHDAANGGPLNSRSDAMHTLFNRREEFQAKIAVHSTQIAEIQKMYEQARSVEERSGAVSESKRWNSVKSVSEAKALLKVLFKVASDLKVQANEYYTENSQLAEESSELQEKLEVMAKEIQVLRENLVKAEAAAVAAVSISSKFAPRTDTQDKSDSEVEDLVQEINDMATTPNKRKTINVIVGNQNGQSTGNAMVEEVGHESDNESDSSNGSNWDPNSASAAHIEDWESDYNGHLKPNFGGSTHDDEDEVLHFINARLARRGEPCAQRLTIPLMEKELKMSIANWHKGRKSRDVVIEEIKTRLMSTRSGSSQSARWAQDTATPLSVSNAQSIRCATPQAQEFLKRREDMMGKLERARARTGRRTLSVQPNGEHNQPY